MIPPAIDNNQSGIIAALNMEIAVLRRAVANECEAPMRDADAMDDFIKHGRQKVLKLMAIREQLEELFFGDIGTGTNK